MSSVLVLLSIILPVFVFVSLPAAVLSFVFVHKTWGGRKAMILVFTILFFVIYVFGLILLSTNDTYSGVIIILLSLPFPVVSLILVLSRPRYVFLNKSNEKTNQSSGMNYLDELERLKKLLESGAITQEEYDVKKRDVLSRK